MGEIGSQLSFTAVFSLFSFGLKHPDTCQLITATLANTSIKNKQKA